MKSILDPSFRYTNSVETDLRKTFTRIRREQRKRQEAQAAAVAAEALKKARPLDQRQRGNTLNPPIV